MRAGINSIPMRKSVSNLTAGILPHYEIAIQGGYSRFVNPNLENVLIR